jgi:hypothetical protein
MDQIGERDHIAMHTIFDKPTTKNRKAFRAQNAEIGKLSPFLPTVRVDVTTRLWRDDHRV